MTFSTVLKKTQRKNFMADLVDAVTAPVANVAAAVLPANPIYTVLAFPAAVIAYEIFFGKKRANSTMAVLNNIVFPLGVGYLFANGGFMLLGIQAPVLSGLVAGVGAFAYFRYFETTIRSYEGNL
jgi:hypothetical protein